jgi:aryl-alcohol dehydrogenase-like predicted oxidoreductase
MFGAGIIHSPELVRYAFDLGITAFDTAEDYTSGVSEKIIGQGLKGIRDKTCIITKQRFNLRRTITESSIVRRLERSLKSLKTDFVDGLFIHSLDSRGVLENDAILNAYFKLKNDGKVRFTGFSTHKETITLAQCLKTEYEGFVDAVMFCYNHMEGRKIEPLIEKLHQRGIGTIAMKTLAGGKHDRLKEFLNDRVTYPHAAIGWVLANSNIDAVVSCPWIIFLS